MSDGSKFSSSINVKHVQANSSVENPSLHITTHKLNGQNFLQWSQSMKLYVKGKCKMGYLDGSIDIPEADNPSYKIWDEQNSMVMSWLINSMNPHISQVFLFLPSARNLWDAATETYSYLENTAHLYEFKCLIHETKKGSDIVAAYYNIMNSLWQELDLYYDGEWKCGDDSKRFKRLQEKERVFEFLAGLNPNLDEVRGRVLNKEPLPAIREVYAYVRREESRRKVMMNSSNTDNSALITCAIDSALVSEQKYMSKKKNDKDKLWCDYCHKPRHTKEFCWKLHGRPQNSGTGTKSFGQNSKGFQAATDNANANSGNQGSNMFAEEQLEQLVRFMSQTPSANLAQTGNFLNAFSIFSNTSCP